MSDFLQLLIIAIFAVYLYLAIGTIFMVAASMDGEKATRKYLLGWPKFVLDDWMKRK